MSELVQIPSPGIALEYGHPGRPVVVILHDVFGRLPWLEPFAEAVSKHGYHVLVPDLYDGWATLAAEDARDLAAMAAQDRALASVADAVRTGSAAGAARSALIGFGFGGRLALLVAATGLVDAVVAYYATLGREEHALVPCPTLLHYAQSDEWPEGDDPESFVGRLKEAGTPVTAHTYPDTGRHFANATLRESVSPSAAALAYARTLSFLNPQLIDC
ncbi:MULTISPECIES: dienelactone hydrolase family protein [unclassified Rathayibacter]|jgi:carboxymethylenebutenolidase|uniref:dienelactone hydrolase family protein n=1 Tax=unclassified Rathayibacter TaxID=2609250 RepID=UPI000F4B4366|nr:MULTISPECIES: dienelactone hydrolase family protein [unclassified Rathayibacter]MCJ1674900.1 dienelactone hydrolase family protein [Rathayibacter sp. VKM Ac-2929]MCJ1683648.1 dienelactone hydrolase family protein [Rathayibacter sp. VKM Ac-2928]MCJ1686383.1 dienelactone hydrolase family protein [Rathayibacter sp. VKM Ac-2927]MCJ1702332.1 dienelactone hydrolase family protein [Rathayibacter sp. VKM Ac-2926]ROP57007.1 carboxymethylenebutenolidase [Rathayibacter sp. PhB186]